MHSSKRLPRAQTSSASSAISGKVLRTILQSRAIGPDPVPCPPPKGFGASPETDYPPSTLFRSGSRSQGLVWYGATGTGRGRSPNDRDQRQGSAQDQTGKSKSRSKSTTTATDHTTGMPGGPRGEHG